MLEEKLELIKLCGCPLSPIRLKSNIVDDVKKELYDLGLILKDGDNYVAEVLIEGCRYDPNSLKICRIKEIDKKGVITTSSGIKYSTRRVIISSTQKIGKDYYELFELEKNYQRALKEQKKQRSTNRKDEA